MNILILNGSPGNGRGATSRKVRDVLAGEFRTRGWDVKVLDLAGMTFNPCRGCFACWLKHPGRCAIQDDGEGYVRAFVASDAVAWITPVTFGGYSSTLKKALDRTIPAILPFFIKTRGEIHHPQRYEKRRKLLVAGTLPEADAEAERIFRNLVQRNAINMHPLKTGLCIVSEHADDAGVAAGVRDLLRAAELE